MKVNLRGKDLITVNNADTAPSSAEEGKGGTIS